MMQLECVISNVSLGHELVMIILYLLEGLYYRGPRPSSGIVSHFDHVDHLRRHWPRECPRRIVKHSSTLVFLYK